MAAPLKEKNQQTTAKTHSAESKKNSTQNASALTKNYKVSSNDENPQTIPTANELEHTVVEKSQGIAVGSVFFQPTLLNHCQSIN